MNYISTRTQGNIPVTSAQAIKQGLAADGGLYLPESIPQLKLSEIVDLCKKSYPERAAYILSKFLSDYTPDELLFDCKDAYGEARFPGGAAPVAAIGDNMRVLELWHGPTCAFKDMALQIMPKLLSRALVKTGERRTAFILVATSGDTGKAALEGYRDIEQIKIMVFYPVSGVSSIQKKQMVTQEGNNVTVCAINGNFDDAQNGVKRIFQDKAVAADLDSNGYVFSSANSINWGRLAPQIVYYVSAYCDMLTNGDIKAGDEINVCVPTGNFGNIFAAYLAKRMGLPINRFICASNKNNILTNFLDTGIYDRNREFYTTMSPSMDILISSNLERLLFLTAGCEKTVGYMNDLAHSGRYTVDAETKKEIDKNFTGLYCDEKKTAEVIKNTFDKYGYLCDTHTAVAIGCAAEYIEKTKDTVHKMLVASTASPYKFAPSVYTALTGKVAGDEFETLALVSEYTKTEIPAPIKSILDKKVRFDTTVEANRMTDEVYKALGIKR